ncbi:MAG: HAMP domain-containing histidine kinase [Oscillospiraceae bacterium]|nr:HAMP domain-containing histidine kinase [Oscillospiraceae bacterium]MBR1458346.1 HAMP domain-containing histidine kinase [Oscillospiraceae bacterium]
MTLQKKTRIPGLSDGYFRLSGVLLFVGILVTGVVMVCSAVATYTDSVKQMLLQNCQALSANISTVYLHDDPEAQDEIAKLIRTAETEYGYRLWLYDAQAQEIYPGEGGSFRLLTAQIRAYVNVDDYMELGYYTDDAEHPQLCCVIRSAYEDEEHLLHYFYVAALSDAANVQEYSFMLVRSLVISLLIAMLVFMLLFRLGTSQIDGQFEEITEVTRQYAEGDFSARVMLPEHATLYPYGSTLNRMAEFIEQNETTRRNFVANVSHELRTPMTTIGGFADGILDGTIPPEQHKKYIRIIAEEIHRLRTLVNSMLNLTRFESGEMQLRAANVDIAQLLIRTVLMFEKRISDKRVEVEGLEDVSLTVRADEDLMFQVLYNLIENAVKFVNEDGVISFSLHEENGTAYICVKNSGEGLADDELPRIFDRFYKTDTSRSKDKTGLGLGLSIARKIVHLHQGHIVVKSVKGEYTSFEVQIPVNGI